MKTLKDVLYASSGLMEATERAIDMLSRLTEIDADGSTVVGGIVMDDDDDDDDEFVPEPLGNGTAHRCDNCRALWAENALKEVQGLFELIEAGGKLPSGECPACGGLCYPVNDAMKADTSETLEKPEVIIASVEGKPRSVWAEFGDREYERFDFETEAEQNAFANGILTAANAWGIDDFGLCFTLEQLAQAKSDDAE